MCAIDRTLAVIAAPAREEATDMPDQIIDAVMARSIQVDAAEAHVLFAWIVEYDPPEHPGRYIARLATTHLHIINDRHAWPVGCCTPPPG